MKCDVYMKCGAMWNVAISDTWCDAECGWNVKRMWNMECVECGVLECSVLDVESYVMRNVVWNCGDDECGICNVLCDARCGK